jgi:butyrate kinase
LPAADFRVLAINPGSTSTKFALYLNEQPVWVKNLRHSDAEMASFRNRPILDQQAFRSVQIEAELQNAGMSLAELNAVVGRGGLLPPLASGTYEVNAQMLEELQQAKRGEHASNLGAYLAHSLATKAGVQAYVVDPVSVDEWPEIARLSGTALLERQSLSHALNSKAVAKRYAHEESKPYGALRLIVAHLGSGISISAHENGRMVDATNSREEGAFSTERAGGVPANQLLNLCFSGKYTKNQIDALLFREGGLQSYLGTKDLSEVERRIDSGDAYAATVFAAMAYQIAKEIGGMAAALRGRVDAILLTGGMAHSEKLVAAVTGYIQWIAPLILYPGEDELQALAEGALRVLRGEERALKFSAARQDSSASRMAATAVGSR